MPRPSLLFLLACAASPLWTACATPLLERHAFEAAAMGTTFRIVLWAEEREAAEAAGAAALGRVHELDAVLSDYDPTSELSRLGRASDEGAPTEWITLSDELYFVLARAQEQARRTAGAFDVTVGPFVRLWRRARRQAQLPTAERVEAARPAVGFRYLELDHERRAARLHARRMRLDLGGIAKGYALDEARAVLARHGLQRVLVDGGGDVLVGMAPPERPGQGAGWRVGLAGSGPHAGVTLLLSACSVATSGDLERFVEIDGVRYSHLLDPAAGRGLTNRLLVSVVAPTGLEADAWASSLSVLGVERGLALLQEYPGIEARFVELGDAVPPREPGCGHELQPRVSRTPGFPAEVSSAVR